MKECILPKDQVGTLEGSWGSAPIPIAFKSGQFSAKEMERVVAAADEWNRYSKASLGTEILDYGKAESPRVSEAARPADPCSQGLTRDGARASSDGSSLKFTGSVVLYKYSDWPYDPGAIAITRYCTSPAKPYNRMYMALIELNYEQFFVEGAKRVPDLTSILVHEFGHMLGVNHSCDTADEDGHPDCSSSSLDPDYYYAVMFPVVNFDRSGYGEQRRKLQDNDQGRANCLYKSGG